MERNIKNQSRQATHPLTHSELRVFKARLTTVPRCKQVSHWKLSDASFKTVVLNLGVVTHFGGGESPFYRGHRRPPQTTDIYNS